MDNLKLLKVRSLPIDDIKGQIVYVSIGEERKRKEVYYLKGRNFVYVDLEKGEEYILQTDVKDVIRGEFMSTQNRVTVSSARSVIIVDCESKALYKRDFAREIQQVGWNDTYDHLAVVFKNGTLMTFMFDTRFELVSQGEGNIFSTVPQPEQVGWGSADTQFQGPIHSQEKIDPMEHHLRPTEIDRAVVSWGGNSNEFVVTYFEEGIRYFKVFDHQCLAKFKSELLKGKLYGPIAWKPQGNIIAAAVFRDERNYIGLFERNGLFRMLFPLVDIYYPITFLSWSSCGKVLNVTQEDSKGQMHICLYVTSNYRWYLKQHLVFLTTNPLYSVCWATTTSQCVELVAVTGNEVIQYKYKFEFQCDHRHNLVAAIDGKTICIHGFLKSVDAAPVSTKSLALCNPINMIAFHPTKDLAAAIDSKNILYYFSVDEVELTLISQVFLLKPFFPLNINHLFWKGDNPHMIIENSPSPDCCSSLHEFDIASRQMVHKLRFDVTLYAIEHIYAIDNVLITHDRKYRTIYREKENPVTSPNLPYAIKVVTLKYGGDIFSISLTAEHELYMEEELVSKGITSMISCRDFLIVTNNTTVFTIKLTRHSVENLPADGLSEFHARQLNESAMLVCMVNKTPIIILHTPRGNLELISCRSLEVNIVEEHLRQKQWAEAIKFMKLARLNWNLLIDLNSDRFYENLAEIIAESNSQYVLNAIVGEISDVNCLTTIYLKTIDIIPYTPLNKRKEFLSKLGQFLDMSGKFIEYLPTVLKIYIDQGDILKAMTYPSILLKSSLVDKAADAVRILSIRVASEDLFKAALQIFNVDLADLVAQKCQMNPQEVDPILKGLRSMDHIQKRIDIHLRYQNWDEAIAYILRRDDLDREETLDFIIEHDVSKRAYVECLRLKVPFKYDIVQLFVQKLVSKGRHTEAAVILVQNNCYDEAIHQFKLAMNSNKCIEYMPLSTFTDEDKKELYKDLAEKLVGIGRYSEAAEIYETQLGDIDAAVMTLADGKLFLEALRLARKYDLGKTIDLIVLPKMMSTLKAIMKQVDETEEEFQKLLERLKKLRNVKKYNFEQLQKRGHVSPTDGSSNDNVSLISRRLRNLELDRVAEFVSSASNDAAEAAPDSDVKSLMSYGSDEDQPFFADSDGESVVTVRSRHSSRSSASTGSTMTQKQIRRMEKQKQDTTPGSRYEDIALIRELHIMITSIFNLGPEVEELFLRLVEYSMVDMNALSFYHSKLFAIQRLMIDEAHHIWCDDFKVDSSATYLIENISFLDEQFRTEPSVIENPGLSWILHMLME